MQHIPTTYMQFEDIDTNTNSCYSEITHEPLPSRLELELTKASCISRKKAFDRGEWGDHRFGTMIVFQGLLNACAGYRNTELNNNDTEAREEAKENILNRASLLWIWKTLYSTNQVPEDWTHICEEDIDKMVIGAIDMMENKYNIHVQYGTDE